MRTREQMQGGRWRRQAADRCLPTLAVAAFLMAAAPTGASAAGASAQAAPRRIQRQANGPEHSLFGAKVGAILEKAKGESPSQEQLTVTLFTLGPKALHSLLDALYARAYYVQLGRGIQISHALEGDLRDAVVAAARRHPWISVRGYIVARLDDPSLTGRTRVLEVLGSVLPGDELLFLDRALEGADRSMLRSLGGPFAAALTAVVSDAGPPNSQVTALYQAVHPSMIIPFLKAVRGVGGARGAVLLSELLQVVPEADPLVLIEIAEIAESVREPLPSQALEAIRWHASSPRPTAQVEAVKALGRFDDVESIPLLIPLLNAEHAPLVAAARRSLEMLSRERHGSDAEAWGAWMGAADRWLSGEAPRLLAEIGGTDPERARRALLKVARYRVFRHSLVEGVQRSLRSSDPRSIELGCAVLGHFGTGSSVAPLLGVLDGDHPDSVRKAALDGLIRATGQNHGEIAADWVAAGWSN